MTAPLHPLHPLHSRHPRLRAALAAAALTAGVALAPLLGSCLPGDTRPTPGVLDFTVEPSEAVTAGVTTEDGWTITFERLLVGIGGASVNGAACNNYSGNRYDRLIEATVPGPQKLATVYGLGTCALRFRVRTPSQSALLGEQVSADDLAFMKLQGSDAHVPSGGTSVYAQGHATREGVTKRFAWQFRLGYSFHDCGSDAGPPPEDADSDAGDSVTIEIHGGDAQAMPLRVFGEELFRAGIAEDAGLRFGPLAEADTDGDEEITLEELAKLPSPEPAEDAGATDAGPPTLADFVYQTRIPRMIWLEGLGRCRADVRPTNL
ncbi:MAG: hypothetical protein ABI193_23495 [Minicystis sp.]